MEADSSESQDDLLIFQFNNGVLNLKAAVYNLYPILEILDIITKEECPDEDTICWIRYYPEGYIVPNRLQLVKLLLNNSDHLRISFFCSAQLTGIKSLHNAVLRGKFPVLRTTGRPPNCTVYTLWFRMGKPLLTKSGINQNRLSVYELFDDIKCGYSNHYLCSSPKSPLPHNSGSLSEIKLSINESIGACKPSTNNDDNFL